MFLITFGGDAFVWLAVKSIPENILEMNGTQFVV